MPASRSTSSSSACPSNVSPGNAGSSRLNDSIEPVDDAHGPTLAGEARGNRRADPSATDHHGVHERPSHFRCTGVRSVARTDQASMLEASEGRDPVGIGLLGYGTVGSSVDALLAARAEDIARVVGRPVSVVRALVRDAGRPRSRTPAEGLLTESFEELRDDPRVSVVAEVMGGIDPTRAYISELLSRGISVVSANKQLLARHGEELWGIAERHGAQLRFEASVCAAIPVVKVLRESMLAARRSRGHRHRQRDDELHPVGDDERGPGLRRGARARPGARVRGGRPDRGRERRGRGRQDRDPRVDRVPRARAHRPGLARGDRHARPRRRHLRRTSSATRSSCSAARALGAGGISASVAPTLVPHGHPLARVEGSFNAVMLRGDAIREVTLQGPGAGGVETATAVIGDLLSVVGTAGPASSSTTATTATCPCWRPRTS